MKLDVENLRYLSKDDFRVLTALELGMRNHDLVPTELIGSIAGLKHGGHHKILGNLLRNKLIAHERKIYDGYRLTYPGYDFLALKALLQRGVITGVGRQIGTGKESDIFLVTNAEGQHMALKLQRLGRVSFRAIKKKRDYLKHRKSASWMYMSRLAALKEFAFMKALHDSGFPTPTPIDVNRHAVVMSLAPGTQLSRIRYMEDPAPVYKELLGIVMGLAKCGLIHCDFNEYNLLYEAESGKVTMIDFPQMLSTSHPNAEELFERDVRGVTQCFERRFGFKGQAYPTFASIGGKERDLDVLIEASGFSAKDQAALQEMMEEQKKEEEEEGEASDREEDGGEEDAEGSAAAAAAAAAAGAGSAAVAAGASSSSSSSSSAAFVTLAAEMLEEKAEDAAKLAAEQEAALAEAEEKMKEAGLTEGTAAAAAGGAGAAAAEEAEEDEEGDEEEEEEEKDEEDDDDEEEEELDPAAIARAKQRRAEEEMLASQRPPEGVRSRAGGGRVKMGTGGEAYLNKQKEEAARAEAETRAAAGGPALTEEEVRRRVKSGLQKKQRRQEVQTILSRAKPNRMKDKEKSKIKDAVKYGGDL